MIPTTIEPADPHDPDRYWPWQRWLVKVQGIHSGFALTARGATFKARRKLRQKKRSREHRVVA